MAQSLSFSNMTYHNLKRLAERFPLVLGSGSPRRLELLRETGVPFRQIVPDIHESQQPGEAPYAFAQRLAEDKALAVALQTDRNEIIIGCDTIVVLGDTVLGKPDSAEEAFSMLSFLAGKQHVVCSAAAFVRSHQAVTSGYELTKVFFNQVTPEQIWRYIETGEPMDKAGSYGIQGMGSFLVDRIEGNLDTVVGLPRVLLERLAGELLSLV